MIRRSRTIDDRVRALAGLLRTRGLSVTHQRLAVYRCLLEDDSHPDADRLYERVRRLVPTISLGTVYKALDTLKQLGAVAEVGSPRSATRYEAVIDPHHHLICVECGRIIDLHEPEYSTLRPPDCAAEGFEVTSCTVQFFGRCRDCAHKQRKPRPLPRRPRVGATTGG